MKYRLTLDLAFDNKADMDTIIGAVKKVKSKAKTINAGLANEEVPRASWHLCGHDEGKPCEKEQEI